MGSKKSAPKKKKAETSKKQPYSLHTIFPTNLLTRDWGDVDQLNDDLKLEIWRKRALNPEGLYRSNVAGTWHSDDALFTNSGEAGKKLQQMFGEAMVEWAGAHGLTKDQPIKMRLAAWAMVYSDRGYAAIHNHPNCHVSGVYHVDDDTDTGELTMATGSRVNPGDLEFVDTRRGGSIQIKGISLDPPARIPFKRGRMCIFPSALPHMVHPVRGPGERISVSCNGTFLLNKPKDK